MTNLKLAIKKDIKHYRKFTSFYGYTRNNHSLIWYFNLKKRIYKHAKSYLIKIGDYEVELNELLPLFVN